MQSPLSVVWVLDRIKVMGEISYPKPMVILTHYFKLSPNISLPESMFHYVCLTHQVYPIVYQSYMLVDPKNAIVGQWIFLEDN
jgi:hypothetical protein